MILGPHIASATEIPIVKARIDTILLLKNRGRGEIAATKHPTSNKV